MATVTGSIVDESTGERIEARVQVLDSTGSFTHPSDAILKVGTGDPFFYSDGSFSVDVPRARPGSPSRGALNTFPRTSRLTPPPAEPWP